MADSTAVTLPNAAWLALAGAVGYVGRWVMRAFQKRSDGELTALKEERAYLRGLLAASAEELRRERADHDATKTKLGLKVDRAERKADGVSAFFMAKLTREQIQGLDVDDPAENTSVTRAVTVAKAAVEMGAPVDPFALSGWDPNAKTPR